MTEAAITEITMAEPGWIAWLLTVLALMVIASVAYWSVRLGITPTPTSVKVQRSLGEVLPAKVRGTVYELGCGWGTLLLKLAKHYPDNRIVGYERSTVPFLIARAMTWRQANITVYRKNFFASELDNAGLITTYLYPGAMQTLSGFLDQALPDGCVVISHTFRLPGWTCVREIRVRDLYRTSVFVYRKGFTKEGVSISLTGTGEYCSHRSPASDTSPAAPENS